jgi:hypothetical protein
VALVDGEAELAAAPNALTLGGLGLANAEVPKVLLPNADVPEVKGDEPNADEDLRPENAPKPADGVAILLLLNGEEAGVVDEIVLPNELD